MLLLSSQCLLTPNTYRNVQNFVGDQVSPFPRMEDVGIVPISRDIISRHLRDFLASTSTYRHRELQEVVAKEATAIDVTYYAGPVVGAKGIATQTVETGEFQASEIDDFKKVQFDPISGKQTTFGLYWKTFDSNIPEKWNAGEIIAAMLK
eukprot:gene19236-22997_t